MPLAITGEPPPGERFHCEVRIGMPAPFTVNRSPEMPLPFATNNHLDASAGLTQATG